MESHTVSLCNLDLSPAVLDLHNYSLMLLKKFTMLRCEIESILRGQSQFWMHGLRVLFAVLGIVPLHQKNSPHCLHKRKATDTALCGFATLCCLIHVLRGIYVFPFCLLSKLLLIEVMLSREQ